MKVLVSMSGGVDSSMAASLLVEAGHEVTGVHLKMAGTLGGLGSAGDQAAAEPGVGPGRGCCTIDDARDARRVADRLGIPFYVWDLSEPFRDRVVDDFVSSYAAGETPNPCVRCNERVKYSALLARARAVGFDALATGHHVRLREPTGGTGSWRMLRAADAGKDQTYVLYMADQDQLAHTLWPAGEHTKDELRAMAAERGLLTAAKPDSHDICFVPDGDIATFLRPRLGTRSGPFVGPDGTVLGHHDGAWRFTVGQRRGLGLGGHDEPLYVTAIDGDTVHVGPRAALDVDTVLVRDISWVAGSPPTGGRVAAQVRYRGRALPAALRHHDRIDEADVAVDFTDELPSGMARGQAVVFYDGDECLGGGTVVAAVKSLHPARSG